jgi:basic amino acid/polyamine antiporter, APA family
LKGKDTQGVAISKTDKQPGHLLRVLGFGFGLAVIIGNTIGSGVFRTQGQIATNLPNVWWFLGVWVVGGLYALLGAVQIAELGTLLPRSGGQYVFVRYALGEYAGFLVGWSDWISTCGSTAAVGIVIGEFSAALFPSVRPHRILLSATVISLFAVLQWQGIVVGSGVQNVTSLIKALAFVILIIAAFIFGRGIAGDTSTLPMPSGLGLVTAFVLSLQAVIFTYDGWAGVVYFSEEVQDPGKDIPRSLFGGIFSIIAIYLLVNLALLYVLPITQIAGKEFAIGTAAQVMFGRHGDTIFLSLTILSMLSAINAYHLMATRVLFAMSRDGLFTRKAATVNAGGTPEVALLLSAAVAVLFIAFFQTFEKVITVLAFFFVANYTLSFLSVFVLRNREPKQARPYRAWGYPWTTALALVGSVLFLAGAVAIDRRNSIYALILLAVSYPIFRMVKRLA